MMKRIFLAFLALFSLNNAYASRCGLAVTFVNAGATEIVIKASIEWSEMEIDSDEEEYFPGDVAHPVKIDAGSKTTELFAFPCGYPDDPKEFWVNYSDFGGEAIKKVKYKSDVEIIVGNGT